MTLRSQEYLIAIDVHFLRGAIKLLAFPENLNSTSTFREVRQKAGALRRTLRVSCHLLLL